MSRRRNRFALVGFAVVVAAFGWGLFELLVMRFDTGAMFPAYSSYRNDPLGTKALYASLDRLPGIEAVRYVDPLERLSDAPAEQTVLMIGVNTVEPKIAPRSFVEEIDTILEKGGRVVLAFAPVRADFQAEELRRAGVPGFAPKEDDDSARIADDMVSIRDQWGIELQHEPLRYDGDGGLITTEAVLESEDALPETMEWHNGLQFDLAEEDWRAVYRCRDEVVVAERTVGRGTLVFVGDSYYLTNEGLAIDRQPALVAWLICPNAFVQFDEQHLGMQRNPGAAALMRRYGLESLIAGFIFLALLFARRAGSSLAPRYSDSLPTDVGELELGRDAHAGFSNLVQRSTSHGDVVGVCVNQWRNSVLPGMGRTDSKALTDALVDVVDTHKSAGPVNAYRAVLNELQERNVLTAYDHKS